jgi:hypothetical protein
MKPIYRIIKHTYYEQCDVKREEFTIQKQYKFWKWIFWETIKQYDCGWGDCYKNPIKFNTESDAIYAIKKLENGNIPDGWRKEVSSVLDFNKG